MLGWLLMLSILFTAHALYDECFMKFEKRSLSGSARLAIVNATVNQCLMECLLEERFQCRSILYYVRLHICVLNSSDKRRTPSKYSIAYVEHRITDYYHRLCYGPAKAMAAVLKNACFVTLRGKVLLGVVDQVIEDISTETKCQKLCLNSQRDNNIICRSIIYYPKEEECIIASENRNTMPDLFVDDDKAIYMENRCIDDDLLKIDSNNSRNENIISLGRQQQVKLPIYHGLLSTADAYGGGMTESATSYDGTQSVPLTPTTTTTEFEIFEPVSSTMPYTTSTLFTPLHIPEKNIEWSGYGAPSEGTTTEFEATLTSVPTVDAKTIDTYGVETGKSVIAESSRKFNRILRDAGNDACFRQIYPLKTNFELVIRSSSIDQCVHICRLCLSCLQNKYKCIVVGFSTFTNHCALGSGIPSEGNAYENEDGALVYYLRKVNC
uniref:Apple domain-containing protein n=1 Tax=Parascaris univalens TaxID=6257 RepID=A0A915B4I1_PARUN